MVWLDDNTDFPSQELASEEGILALGGDLSVARLKDAYSKGIFPWFNEGDPIIWYCPLERMVLYPDEIRISKSMRQVLGKNNFKITENKAFSEVLYHCKYIHRKDQLGTWITNSMETAYLAMYNHGYAKSIEVWQGDELVGGLYGVDLGNGVFCGESMFSKRSNMSKVAFIHLAKKGGYRLIDCQVHNAHLESLGAREIERTKFLKLL